MNTESQSPIYSHEVLDFTTVAVQYCVYLEQSEKYSRKQFSETMLKMLPLLYLKGMLLPKYENLDGNTIADGVTEENYNIVRGNIASIMGSQDDYLDVFVEDMRYSDTPVLATVSENLADIYQDIKNFALAFQNGCDEERMVALCCVKETFEYYWGLRTANVMRALHEIVFNSLSNEEEEYDEY